MISAVIRFLLLSLQACYGAGVLSVVLLCGRSVVTGKNKTPVFLKITGRVHPADPF
jgi:hypothetical protein